MPQKGLKVEGVEEAQRAFNRVKEKVEDMPEVHKREADLLLGDITAITRKKSGVLAASWIGEGTATEAKFINDVEYAGVQEYGWGAHNIEPTNAIEQAFLKNEKQTEALYADAIGDIAGSAGFDTDKT